MKDYRNNPVLRASVLAQLPDLPGGEKRNGPASPIVGPRGQQLPPRALPEDPSKHLPPPGDTGGESISACEEMRMACAWLLSLNEEDSAAALGVIRAMREGYIEAPAIVVPT